MLRKSLIPLALAAVALCAAPALAQEQEVIYFTNGTTMTVESHTIEDGMVQVNLGGQSYMAFPMHQIDKIETAQGEVAIPREGANRMVPSPSNAGVQRGVQPGHVRRGHWTGVEAQSSEDVDVDDKGVAVFRPFGTDAAANKRQFGVAGRRELRNTSPSRNPDDGFVGTSRVGARYVLPPKMQGGRTRQPTGLAKGSSVKTNKKDK
jgi:hypothetical protein